MTQQKRSHLIGLLIVATLLFGVLTVFAQDGEPLANPDCAADQLGVELAEIEQLYADAQTALQDGDVRGWLDNLQAISQLTSSLRAVCDNYVFEGDAEGSSSQVFGPITFEPGTYIATVTTDGYIILRADAISGDCRRFSMAFSEGDANEGAQEVYRVEDEPCTVLLELTQLSEPWRVEFSLLSDN